MQHGRTRQLVALSAFIFLVSLVGPVRLNPLWLTLDRSSIHRL
jgi:hypothetical protein